MFGLLSRSPRKASAPPRRTSFRPTLERLETRDCPSLIYANITSESPSTGDVTITGQVTNTQSPGGLQVNFSGVVAGFTTTEANGDFTMTLLATGPGSIYTATADGQSNIVTSQLADPGPTISQFYAGEQPLDTWTFVGQVTGGYQGEVVNFSGLTSLDGKSAKVYIDPSTGNAMFKITVVLNGLQSDNGDAYAVAVDSWGVQSPEASYWVMQT